MKTTRRKFTASFKAKVAIEALKEQKTLGELSQEFKPRPNIISTWKRDFLANAAKAFSSEGQAMNDIKAFEREKEELYKQIGQLKVENDWLKKRCYDTRFHAQRNDRPEKRGTSVVPAMRAVGHQQGHPLLYALSSRSEGTRSDGKDRQTVP